MKLYHGTSDVFWGRIQEEGLLPRGSCSVSNWDHSIESNPETIYLTTGYALYFAINAMNFDDENPGKKAVVIEIDSDDLDQSLLVPDEDALEQGTRKGSLSRLEMLFRTREFRDEVKFWATEGFDWRWSLDKLGTCGHVGPIPPEKFSRVALVDISVERNLTWMMMDVSVSVANHMFLKDRNENAHRALFGDPLIESDMAKLMPVPPIGAGVQILNFKESLHV